MREVRVFAPGSASNLGPGFDCLGVALAGKGDRVVARPGGPPGVRVQAVSDARIPTDPTRNTAAIAAAAVLRRLGSPAGLDLSIEKGLPLSGGMGGSAASAVAGAVAAMAALGARLATIDLLEAALEAEAVVAGRHADNVAPSLLGGAVLVAGLDPPRVTPVRVHADVVLVLATPAYEVETARARAVLPREIARGEAVAQAAALARLVLGLERGDGELIGDAMVDRIAEPARRPFYPGYAEVQASARQAGAYGVAVSGAGPTLLALAHREVGARVAQAMADGYAAAGIRASTLVAAVDAAGAHVEA